MEPFRTDDNPVKAGEDPVVASPFAVEESTVAPPTTLGDSIITPNAGRAGEQARTAARRPTATYGETAKAAVKTWATASILDSIVSPGFETDPEFKPSERLDLLPFAPTQEEEKLLQRTRSNEEFDYMVGRVESLREAAQAIGDHPVLGFAAAMADPAYILTDMATLGAARALRAGRVTSAVAAAAGSAGVDALAMQNTPITAQEVIFGALINGAAVGALHRTPKVGEAPGLKSQEVPGAEGTNKALAQTVAQATDNVKVPNTVFRKVGDTTVSDTPNTRVDSKLGASQVTPVRAESFEIRVKRSVTPPAGAQPLREFIGKTIPNVSDPLTKATLRNLLDQFHGASGGDINVVVGDIRRSYYNPADDTVYLRSTAGPDMLAHETAHALTNYKIQAGLANPSSTHGAIVKEMSELRKLAKEALRDRADLEHNVKYYLGEGVAPHHHLDEFVAGIYSGDAQFLKALAEIQVPNSPRGESVLSNFMDAVRRILGLGRDEGTVLSRAIGLTEDLIATPLDVKRIELGSGEVAQVLREPASVVDKELTSLAAQAGMKTSWNLHKTMAGINKGVADRLVSDPLDQSKTSASSLQRAIRADLSAMQYKMTDAIREEMTARGVAWYDYLTNTRKAMDIQHQIGREVAAEMARREAQAARGATPTPGPSQSINKIADAAQDIADASLREQVNAGVFGAAEVRPRDGYFPRAWNGASVVEALRKFGGEYDSKARAALAKQVAPFIRHADMDLAAKEQIASAILERAVRATDESDTGFRGHMGLEVVSEMRDMLQRQGLGKQDIDRIVGLIEGRVDEAGKPSHLKSRIDLDMTGELDMPDGSRISIMDLLETDLVRLYDNHLDDVAGRAALSRVGLPTETELAKLRQEFVMSAPAGSNRAAAGDMYDNTIKAIMGRPVGENMTRTMRFMSAAAQMTGLAFSGLWQVTEYAKIMTRYGLARTGQQVMRELPGLRNITDNAYDANSLNRVLTRNSYQDLRLRPFLSKMEDNYQMSNSDVMMNAVGHIKQWVPYINAMKYIHHHQARVSGNLIMDTVQRAVDGDAKASAMLGRFGVSHDMLEALRKEVKAHGMDVDKWSDGAWERFRDPLTRMIDEDVLRSKTGEIPAFAQFSAVGKFLFTFRSFVLGAHNKILANTLVNEGAGSYALLMAYQFPLTMMMTQVANVVRGDGFMEPGKEWVDKSFAQMGALGLWTELYGVIVGDKVQWGTPGMLAVDRGFRLANTLTDWSDLSAGKAVGGTLESLPLISIIPGIRLIEKLWE